MSFRTGSILSRLCLLREASLFRRRDRPLLGAMFRSLNNFGELDRKLRTASTFLERILDRKRYGSR